MSTIEPDANPAKTPSTSSAANSITKKAALVLGLTGLLMIPLCQVREQVTTRQDYESQAQNEVAQGWGYDAVAASPIHYRGQNFGYAEVADTSVNVESFEKKRGLFQVPVYTAKFKSKFTFGNSRPMVKIPPPPKTETYDSDGKRIVKTEIPEKYDWNDVLLEITPISSIQSFTVKELTTGTVLKPIATERGLRLSGDDLPDKSFLGKTFEVELVMRGTGSVRYNALADKETVVMTGNWKKPKFLSDYLPADSTLNDSGFTANWSATSIAKIDTSDRSPKVMGFQHLWIGSDYSMVTRAVKYGILFIALTFLLLFALEIIGKSPIHPVQYALIGLSVAIFYLLLLALSEVIGFDLAYLVAGLSVTAVIGIYVHGFVSKGKFVGIIVAEQIALNGFFFALISLEERALLVGTLALFFVLATLMILTRKLNWYSGSYAVEQQTSRS